METLQSLGRKIGTAQDLQSIVRMMKSLSAVNIRHFEQAALSIGVNLRAVEQGFQILLRHQPRLDSVREDLEGPTAAVICGSDHGLCGRFNHQIVEFAERKLGELGTTGSSDSKRLVVGVRAAARMESLGSRVDECFLLPAGVGGLVTTAQRILVKLDEWRTEGAAMRIMIFFNRRTEKTMASSEMIQLLPLDTTWLDELARRPWPSRRLPTFTMEPTSLFAALVRQYVFAMVYHAGAESIASEHAARLASMQTAERNIRDHLEDMNAKYRQKRQDSITDELLDIVSSFETLTAQDAKGRQPLSPE